MIFDDICIDRPASVTTMVIPCSHVEYNDTHLFSVRV